MDFDGDGKLDLVSGSYRPGDTRFFLNLLDFLTGSFTRDSVFLFRGLGKMRFAALESVVDRDGNPVNPLCTAGGRRDTLGFRQPMATEPFVVDWDGDGDLDLLIGGLDGEIVLIRNEGARDRPSYAGQGRLIRHNGWPILVPAGMAGPEVADWDGDGLPDLLTGSDDGAVFFFRNEGTRCEPCLGPGMAIIPMGAHKAFLRPGQDPSPGESSRIHVTDYNGDGKPDILLGDMQRILRFRGDLNDQEQKSVDTWLRERREAEAERDRLRQARNQEILRPDGASRKTVSQYDRQLSVVYDRIDDLETRLAAFTDEDGFHGFVWVFLRR